MLFVRSFLQYKMQANPVKKGESLNVRAIRFRSGMRWAEQRAQSGVDAAVGRKVVVESGLKQRRRLFN